MTEDTSSPDLVSEALRGIAEAMAIFDPFRFRAWAELGLTTGQLRVLFLARETPGVTAGELASRLSVTPPTISGIVDRLVRLGLVNRQADARDGRLVRNYLTEIGETTCSRFEQGGDMFTRRMLVEMREDDLVALVRGLDALTAASRHVNCVEPNYVDIVMPGTS